jgi:hypothetical protein
MNTAYDFSTGCMGRRACMNACQASVACNAFHKTDINYKVVDEIKTDTKNPPPSPPY